MRGQSIVDNSVFGKIDSNATTMDGRNIGQMQTELASYLDNVLDKLIENKGQMKESDAVVAVDSVIRQALRRKIWGSTELDVMVERDGLAAIQGVNANDIVKLAQESVRAIYA